MRSDKWRRGFDIAKVVGIFVACGMIGGWYAVYADNKAEVGASIGVMRDDIKELKDDVACQEKINADQDRIMVRLEEFYKLTAPGSYNIATHRADSVIRAREDSIQAVHPAPDSGR